MKAAIFHEYGGPEVIQIEDLPEPEAGPGQALVEVRAVGLNHLDLFVRMGLPGIRSVMPHIGGGGFTRGGRGPGPRGGSLEGGQRGIDYPPPSYGGGALFFLLSVSFPSCSRSSRYRFRPMFRVQ